MKFKWLRNSKTRGLRIIFIFFFCISVANSHSPHEVIDSLDISPSYQSDRTVFIIVSDKLRKSTDGGGSWQSLINGLDNKGILMDVAVSPTYDQDNTVFVSSDGDGIYKSSDKGQSWLKVNTGLLNTKIDMMAIYSNYHEQKIVLASEINGGMYRTEDGGQLWKQVLPSDSNITAVAFLSGEAKNHVLAGDKQGKLYESKDAGKNWQLLGDLGDEVTSIAASPAISNDSTFFVGTRKSGLMKTADAGKTFTRLVDKLLEQVVSVKLSPNFAQDSTILVSTWYQAAFISNDAGATWNHYGHGLSTDHQADTKKYFAPHFKDIRISNNYNQDGTVFLGGYDGLFKSDNGGRNWIQKETLPLGSIRRLAVQHGDNDHIAAAITTYGGGAYVTNDDGQSWIVANKGLETTRLTDIVFSPVYSSDGTIFSGASDNLLKSVDSGHSWLRINLRHHTWKQSLQKALKRIGMKSLSELMVKSLGKGSAYPTHIVLSPEYSKDNTVFFGTKLDGIYQSVEGGSNPEKIWRDGNKPITDLIISPNFKNDGTLFTAVRATGVYKTTDAGKSWRQVNNGFEFLEAWQDKIFHQIEEKDIELAISPDYQNDETVFAGSSDGLYKTVNGGKDWTKVQNSDYGEDAYVEGLAISPNYRNDQTLLVSIRGRGLFKSQDGGETFLQIAHSLIENNHLLKKIVFDPSYQSTGKIYGTLYENFCVSIDAGKNWKIIASPVRYEDMRDTFRYKEMWEKKKSEEYSARSVHFSEKPGAQAELSFVGTGIKWIGTSSDSQGLAKVYVDGEFRAEVDQYSISPQVMVDSFSLTGLPQGEHIIRIDVTGNKNSKSNGARIEIDAFDVIR